jgi:Protein of unknown function (DUF707)
MVFHYDGVVDGWGNLDWTSSAIHVAAINQTKWYDDSNDIVSYSHLRIALIFSSKIVVNLVGFFYNNFMLNHNIKDTILFFFVEKSDFEEPPIPLYEII